ncbi:MAG TPA: phosphatase PAP2 family protein [Gemmataceae bacterium]|nr:phosphatase PAP2 family protein [Gemmataceae bacterium]
MDQTLTKNLETASEPILPAESLDTFSWAPWLIAIGGSFLLFLALTWLVLTGEAQDFDRSCRDAMQAHAQSHTAVRHFFWLVTWVGGVVGLTLLATAGTLSMLVRKNYLLAAIWVLATAGGALVNLGVKHSVNNPRPETETRDASVAWLTNPSYPSGHAMGSAIGVGMCLFVVLRFVKKKRARIRLASTLILLILLIGLSRIYLRAHWVTDVLGGFSLGACWLILCLAIYVWARRTPIPDLRVLTTAGTEAIPELVPQAGRQEA